MGFAERFRALVPGGKTSRESSRGNLFFSAFFRLEEVAFGHSLQKRQDRRDSIRASQKGSARMTKKSSKPTSSQALKLSLLAGAGAAGVMGQDAAAEIISQNLNQQGGNVYFTYSGGAIGTSNVPGAMKGYTFQSSKYWGHTMNGTAQGNTQVVNGGPLSLNTLIDSSSAWTGQWYEQGPVPAPNKNGFFGVRFSNGSGGWNYGWVDVQWLGGNTRFGMAAVETTLNTPILAGQTTSPDPVPEIDPASAGSAMSLVAGVLAMVEQRRRRRAVPATSAVA
jgi:hypothetical protein